MKVTACDNASVDINGEIDFLVYELKTAQWNIFQQKRLNSDGWLLQKKFVVLLL